MIRQAISCDICGAEKKQTNHWFVAWEQGGELRLSGWNSRNRMRAGAKHLCGQVCLHKLADDFMARVIAQKIGGRAAGEEEETSLPALREIAPAPRPEIAMGMRPPWMEAEVESSARLLPAPDEEPPRSDPRSRRAEAWARERARAQRSGECRPEIVARGKGRGN